MAPYMDDEQIMSERAGRRARKLLRRLLGKKQYSKYLRKRVIVVYHGKQVYEVAKERTEVHVFRSRADYRKYNTARKRYPSDYTWMRPYAVECGHNPVTYERLCIVPDHEKLSRMYTANMCGNFPVHVDEETLIRYLLAKYSPRTLRKFARRVFAERETDLNEHEESDLDVITRRDLLRRGY